MGTVEEEKVEDGGKFSQQYDDNPPAKEGEKKPPEGEKPPAAGEEKKPERKPVSEAKTDADQAIEDIAEDIGWNPDYAGKDKIDARTYIKRSRKIQDDLGGRLETMSTTLNDLKTHQDKVAAAKISKLESQLKREKREAVVRGEVDEVEEIDEKLDKLKEDAPKATKPKEGPGPAYTKWVKANSWYEDNPDMAEYADKVGKKLFKKYEGAPGDRVFKKITEAVKEIFPEEFEPPEDPDEIKDPPPRKRAVSNVLAPGTKRGAGKAKTFRYSQLNSDQKQVCDRFVAQGAMKQQDYVDQLGEMGELG